MSTGGRKKRACPSNPLVLEAMPTKRVEEMTMQELFNAQACVRDGEQTFLELCAVAPVVTEEAADEAYSAVARFPSGEVMPMGAAVAAAWPGGAAGADTLRAMLIRQLGAERPDTFIGEWRSGADLMKIADLANCFVRSNAEAYAHQIAAATRALGEQVREETAVQAAIAAIGNLDASSLLGYEAFMRDATMTNDGLVQRFVPSAVLPEDYIDLTHFLAMLHCTTGTPCCNGDQCALLARVGPWVPREAPPAGTMPPRGYVSPTELRAGFVPSTPRPCIVCTLNTLQFVAVAFVAEANPRPVCANVAFRRGPDGFPDAAFFPAYRGAENETPTGLGDVIRLASFHFSFVPVPAHYEPRIFF